MISSIVWSLSDLPFLSDSAVAVSEKLEVLIPNRPYAPSKCNLVVVAARSYILNTPSPPYVSHSSVPSSPNTSAPPVEPCIERLL